MMRKKATVLVLHADEMMDHFVVDDTFQDIGRDKSPVQDRVDADDLAFRAIAAESHPYPTRPPPSSPPGNFTVQSAFEKKLIELQIAMTKREMLSFGYQSRRARLQSSFIWFDLFGILPNKHG